MKDMVKVTILILIGILAVVAISNTVSADNYWIHLGGDEITEDGHTDGSSKVTGIDQIRIKRYGGTMYGYVEFNITTIPDEATILNTTILFDGLLSDQWYGVGDYVTINGIDSVRPNTSSASDINSAAVTEFARRYHGWGTGVNKTINETTGGWTTSPSSHIQNRLTNDWYAIMFKIDGDDGKYYIASEEHATNFPVRLEILYEITTPQIANETPADFSDNTNLSTDLCINISHDQANTMNVTWYWYNESSASFEEFANDTGLSNGTVCQEATWATEPCTEYTWYVSVEDENGNFTNAVYTFTTHCINPPSDLNCYSGTETSINISFTKKPDNNGTTYTYMRYQHGAFPPGWGEGTFGENTTNSSINTTGLVQGQCYAFSFWTVWQAADGEWIRSDYSNQIVCCCAGGDYRICLKEEETGQPIDFGVFPYNLSTFILRIHYYDNTEDDFYIYGDNATNVGAGGVTLYSCDGSENCFNASAVNDVWYFELICFQDFNTSALNNGQSGRATYSRKLTPDVAINTTCSGNDMETITFWVSNRTIYGNNYPYVSSGNLTYIPDSDFVDSLVEYEYYFIDESGDYSTQEPNTVYISIYEPSVAKNKTIHQEFFDASKVINPFLIYSKDYLLGVYDTESNNQISNFGIAPTSQTLQQQIYIRENASSNYIFNNVNITNSRVGEYFNISYYDYKYLTDNVTVKLFDESDSLVSERIKYGSDFNFTFTGLNTSKSYYAIIFVNRSNTINSVDVNYFASTTIFSPSLFSPVVTSTWIDNLITSTIGPVFIGSSWSYLIVVVLTLVTLLGLLPYTGPASAFIGSGVVSMFLNALISGLNPIIFTIGAMLLVFGFIVIITEVRQRRY